MAGLSAYIDVPYFLRAPHGQETGSLLGMNTSINGAMIVGATSLLVASSAGWAAGLAWILDGPNSEQVVITGSVDGTHVTIAAPGLQFAHGAGVSISQAGVLGSLAEIILRASGFIEGYCQQGTPADRSLFAAVRSEKVGMPSLRCFLDRDAVVTFNASHFPVTAVGSFTVEFGTSVSLSLDVTQAEIASSARSIEIPYLLVGQISVGQQLWLSERGLSRSRRMWANVGYTAGVVAGQVPWDLQMACVWIVADMMAQRNNPTGAAEYRLGKKTIVARQRGDLIGDSILLLRAHDLLQPFVREAWA